MNPIFPYKYLIINLFIISCIGIFKLNAQTLDQNPPGIHWRQINTPNFQIIYPADFETEAQRMGNTLQKLIPHVAQSLNKLPRKISIILQNQGIISNGFVTLAPRRSEFFTTATQEFDAQDWLNTLAVHELRHVVQYDKLGGNLIKIPLFEGLTNAILSIQVPSWVWEGDAVGIETALSTAGRGRLPNFELPFRTNTLSGRNYSYTKNHFGSMKDITAGIYPLGFFIMSKLRRDYGAGILDSIMTHVRDHPFNFYTLSRSIKKYTRLNTRQLHDATVAELRALWQQQQQHTNAHNCTPINNRKDQIPTDYLLPIALANTQILVLKKSRKDTPRFVILDATGNESPLLRIGRQGVDNFDCHAEKIVWDEMRSDPRFQQRSFNVINLYDLKSKKYRQLTHRTRLFTPTLSPDGKTIIAVHIVHNNDTQLVELDARNGQIIKKYPNLSAKLHLRTPRFNADGSKIACIAVNEMGTSILEFDHVTGLASQLIPFQCMQLTRPSYADRKILFGAYYNGLDNIYELDPDNKNIMQLSSAQYGAFNPSYDATSKQLFFNQYQVRGHDLVAMPYPQDGISINQLANTFIDFAKPLVLQEGNKNQFNDIPTKEYASKAYRAFNHAFYFCGIDPIWAMNNQNTLSTLGIQLISKNKFNTIDLTTAYWYDMEIKGNAYAMGLSYKYFYPILNFSYSNLKQSGYDTQLNPRIATTRTYFSWREQKSELKITIPFIANQLNKTYSLGLNLSTGITHRYQPSLTVNNFARELKLPVAYESYFNSATAKSILDLNPRWGQRISVTYKHFVLQQVQKGDLLSLKSLFFFPGLKRNHSFSASFNYQKSSGDYTYAIDIPRVSGYTYLTRTTDLTNTFLLNYQFPMAYPDWRIGPLAYIKRLRGSFFSDFENIDGADSLSPKTYGITLTADINLFGFRFLDSALQGKLIFINENRMPNPIFEFGLSLSY